MNDQERENWVQNDEVLYTWWRSTGDSLRRFIRAERKELDRYIAAKLTPPKNSGILGVAAQADPPHYDCDCMSCRPWTY